MIGLCESQEKDKKQKPIKITITPNNPFQLNDFANVMHEIGIDISSSLKQDENAANTTITFQPKPYGNSDFLKGIIASKQTTEHFIASFLDFEPSQINSKPH